MGGIGRASNGKMTKGCRDDGGWEWGCGGDSEMGEKR